MNYINEEQSMSTSGNAASTNHRLSSTTSIAEELDGTDGSWFPLCWEKEVQDSGKQERPRGVLNKNSQQDPNGNELINNGHTHSSTSVNVFHQHPAQQPEQHQQPAAARNNEYQQQQPPPSPYYLHPHDEQGQHYSQQYPPYYYPHQYHHSYYYPAPPALPPLDHRRNKTHAANFPSSHPISSSATSTSKTTSGRSDTTTSSKPAAPVLTAWSQSCPPHADHPGHQEQLQWHHAAAPNSNEDGSVVVDASARYTPPLVHQQSAPSESYYHYPAEEQYQAPPASSYHRHPQWPEGAPTTPSIYYTRTNTSQEQQHAPQEQQAVLVSTITATSDDVSYYQHGHGSADFDQYSNVSWRQQQQPSMRVSDASGYTSGSPVVYYYEDEMMMEHQQQKKKRHYDTNIDGQVKPKRKKRKKSKVADDEPRRPLSAYNFFFSEEKDVVVALLPERTSAKSTNNVDPADISQDSTSDSATAISDCQSMNEEEVDVQICDMDVDKIQEHLVESKGKVSTEDFSALRQTVESQTERTLLAHLEGDKPKKSHKKSHGKISFQKLASVIGKRWHDLSGEDKKRYFDLAKEDQARFKKQMELLGMEE